MCAVGRMLPSSVCIRADRCTLLKRVAVHFHINISIKPFASVPFLQWGLNYYQLFFFFFWLGLQRRKAMTVLYSLAGRMGDTPFGRVLLPVSELPG